MSGLQLLGKLSSLAFGGAAMNYFPTAKIPQARGLVIGDVMLDRYWFGRVERISPEAPVPVVHVVSEEERLGGAANVARNIAEIGRASWRERILAYTSS